MGDEETRRELEKFKRDYYERMDIDRLISRLKHIADRCERLKDPVKVGREVFDLYHQYLQVLETFFINAFALGKPMRNFPTAIFIDSSKLQLFITDHFMKKTRYSTWFLTNYVLWPHAEKGEEKVRMYENLLMECAKDYIDNYQLLNAYKHGARVSAAAGEAYMTVKTQEGKVFRIADGDSSIQYYSKEKHEESGQTAIYERDLTFKRQRVIAKATFIITILQNARLMALKSLGVGTDKRQQYMYFEYDKQAWRDSFGGYSFKRSLFTVQKQKKPRKPHPTKPS